ncbi:unnamed protein product [Sphagnum balticum]
MSADTDLTADDAAGNSEQSNLHASVENTPSNSRLDDLINCTAQPTANFEPIEENIYLCKQPKNQFIMEYVGEVVDAERHVKRSNKYAKSQTIKHHYFMALKGGEWSVNRCLRIGFFSKRQIEAGEEITFDYQFERFGEAQICLCGAPSCRGVIGGEISDTKKESLAETRAREKRRRQIMKDEQDDLKEDEQGATMELTENVKAENGENSDDQVNVKGEQKEDGGNTQVDTDCARMAGLLIEKWASLPDAFKIPKKDRSKATNAADDRVRPTTETATGNARVHNGRFTSNNQLQRTSNHLIHCAKTHQFRFNQNLPRHTTPVHQRVYNDKSRPDSATFNTNRHVFRPYHRPSQSYSARRDDRDSNSGTNSTPMDSPAAPPPPSIDPTVAAQNMAAAVAVQEELLNIRQRLAILQVVGVETCFKVGSTMF